MTSIFKRKKSKNEIEEVVVEKVVVVDEPVQQQQQQQKQHQQQQQQQSATPDKKKSGKSFKLLFSLSRSAKKCDEADFSHSDDVNKTLASHNKENDAKGVTVNHVTNGDGGTERKKSRWARRTKASPPPPPAVTSSLPLTKSNSVTLKSQAPQPPVTSSPEPPPPPPKNLKSIPVSTSMTSLRNATIPNGVTQNGGKASQPVTPAMEKKSELVTKLRQGDEADHQQQRDAKMLLRSGLEAEDINLTGLNRDEDAGISDEKGKRKNLQVRKNLSISCQHNNYQATKVI